ncbi:unnamed protein product [Chrysoparadoxa australica]
MAPGLSTLSKSWKVTKTHRGAYNGGAIQLSRDGTTMACLYDGDVKLLDVKQGEVTRGLKGENDEEEIVCFALHPLRNEIVTASRNLLLRHWDIATGVCKRAIKAHEQVVLSMDYDSTGTLVATGSADGTAKVWDVERGYCTHNFRDHLGTVSFVRFDTRSLRLGTASEDRSVRIWDLEAQGSVAVLKDHMSVPTGIVFMGDIIATVGRDSVVLLYSSDSYKLLKTLPVYECVEGVVQVAWGDDGEEEEADGMCFAIAGSKGSVRVYRCSQKSASKGKLNCELLGQQATSGEHAPGYSHLLTCPAAANSEGDSSGCQQLVAVTVDHNFIVLEAREGLPLSRQIVGCNDEIVDIKAIPRPGGDEQEQPARDGAGQWLAVLTNSPQVRLFKQEDFSTLLLDAHTDTVLSAAVNRDGSIMATASKDKRVLIWAVASVPPRVLLKCTGHTDSVGAVSLSNKPGPYRGGGAFAVSGSIDKTLKKWLLPKDSGDDESSGSEGAVTSAAISVRAHEKDINAVAVSPNDALVATASQDRTTKLWKSNDLSPVGVLKGHKKGVWQVKFSPIDRCVVTCSGDRTVKLWSVVDCACLRTFQGHTASVLNVVFLTAGTQLMSAGADGLLKLWTIRTNECEATFDSHEDRVWALTTVESENGVQVISGGADSVLNVWSDVTAQEAEEVIKAREEAILKEQQLAGSIARGDLTKAISLAFDLKKPHKLWHILKEMLSQGEEGERGADKGRELLNAKLDAFVKEWDDEKLLLCLTWCKDWNTNARKSAVAQALLASLFRSFSFARLKKLPGISDVTAALLAYSERHYARYERLLQSSYMVEYTLDSMQLLLPPASGEPGATEEADEEMGEAEPAVHSVVAVPFDSSDSEDETVETRTNGAVRVSQRKRRKKTDEADEEEQGVTEAVVVTKQQGEEARLPKSSKKGKKHRKSANTEEDNSSTVATTEDDDAGVAAVDDTDDLEASTARGREGKRRKAPDAGPKSASKPKGSGTAPATPSPGKDGEGKEAVTVRRTSRKRKPALK